MPRIAVTATIAASDTQHLVQGALAAGVCLLAGWLTPSPVGAFLTASIAAALIQARRSGPVGELRCLVDDTALASRSLAASMTGSANMSPDRIGLEVLSSTVPGRWEWRSAGGEYWQPITLQCVALGPRLMALRWSGSTTWLWPDAMADDERHALRRYLSGYPLYPGIR